MTVISKNPNTPNSLRLCLTRSLRMDPVTSSSLRCRLNLGGMLSSGCSSRSGSLCRTGGEEDPSVRICGTVGELFENKEQSSTHFHQAPKVPDAHKCYTWRSAKWECSDICRWKWVIWLVGIATARSCLGAEHGESGTLNLNWLSNDCINETSYGQAIWGVF